MDIHLLLVPYDTARRRWRSGAGPEHLLENGLTTHLHGRGHSVADIQVIDADPNQPPAEIGTAFELMRRIAVADGRYEVDPVQADTTVVFIGAGGRELSRLRETDGRAVYAVRGDEGYVRARVELADGKRAWTPAIRVSN